MAENFFERVQVPAVHQKMKGKRMPQVMEPHVIYPCPFQSTPPTSFQICIKFTGFGIFKGTASPPYRICS
jgi:hypothetical protein